MALPYFYYPYNYRGATIIHLEGAIVKHIVQVLRMKEGELLRLTDGKGVSADTVIRSVSKKNCEVSILKTEDHIQPRTQLCLAIAFTKNASRNEWLLEKATELGVSVIQPILTKRTEKVHIKDERWQNILVSAMLQSQQYYLPVLEKPKELSQIITEASSFPQKLMAHCENDIERKPLSEMLLPGQSTLVLIGPEGDFTREEIDAAVQNNFQGINLGNNRLRTETAAMAVCAYFKMMNP